MNFTQKFSLKDLFNDRNNVLVSVQENIDPFSDYGRRRGVKYYFYQAGHLIEYRMDVKNHGHDYVAQVTVYDNNGNIVKSAIPAQYSYMSEQMVKARMKLRSIFGRKSAGMAAGELAFQKFQAAEKKRRAAEHAEVMRRMRLRQLESNKRLIDANILRGSVLGEYLKSQRQKVA